MNIYILLMDVFPYKVRIHEREHDFFTQNKKRNMHVLSIIRHIFNYHLLGGGVQHIIQQYNCKCREDFQECLIFRLHLDGLK